MKISRTTVLPVKLKNELDGLELTGIQRQHAYRLCDLIINKQSRDEHDYSSYVELPQEYLRKLFGGGNYHRFFDKLKSQIIQVDGWVKATGEFVESYTNSDGEGQSKRYRIQPDLLAYSFTPATYQTKDFEGSNGQIKLACGHFSKEVVLCDIGKLKINKEKLLHVMEEHIKTIQKDNFEIDRQIKDTAFDIHDWLSGYEGFTKLELCLQRAQRNSVNVIKDKRKFILADVDKYIAQKQKNIRLNYTRSIEMLCNSACHYADRNTANDRLDHNLTSISKVLLPVIKAENNLVEVDMNNSQFAILAWLMKNDQNFTPTSDFEIFAAQVSKGTLYEYIRDEYGLKDRNSAKAMMFELAFSGHKNSSPDKCKLKVLFPSVVAYCDQYKKKHGDNALAIWLQKEEAKLFVDNIYYQLKQQGLWVLSRHDSLLVNVHQAEYVQSFAVKSFKALKLDCTIGIKAYE